MARFLKMGFFMDSTIVNLGDLWIELMLLSRVCIQKHLGLFFDDVSNPLAHVCGVGSVMESDGARGWDVIEHLMSKSCRVFSEMVLVT